MKKFLLNLLIIFPIFAGAQPMTLSLQDAIEIANDSSLQALRAKNLYQSSYWEFISYKAA